MIPSITVISVAGVMAILAIIYLRPHEDNTQLIIMVLGFLNSTIVSMVALVRARENKADIEELHTRTTALVKSITSQSDP